MNEIYIFLVYSLVLIGVMLVAELTFRFLHFTTEWTRKIAHIGAGIVALSYPHFIHNHLIVLALALSFTVILMISKKFNVFPSIFTVERKSYGELFFVWTTWLLFLLYQITHQVVYFYLPFAVVVFADPVAALIGQSLPLVKLFKKSLGGSLAFFIVSLFLIILFMPADKFENISFWLFAVFYALILTVTELISHKGFDNFSIPLVAVILLKLFF